MGVRYEEMEAFLKRMALDGKTTREAIYLELANYGLTEEERKQEGALEKLQRQLEEQYRDDKNGICRQVKYFLGFRDKNVNMSNKLREQSIKLYIPANQESMEKLAPALFDFLSRKFHCTRF